MVWAVTEPSSEPSRPPSNQPPQPCPQKSPGDRQRPRPANAHALASNLAFWPASPTSTGTSGSSNRGAFGLSQLTLPPDSNPLRALLIALSQKPLRLGTHAPPSRHTCAALSDLSHSSGMVMLRVSPPRFIMAATVKNLSGKGHFPHIVHVSPFAMRATMVP